MTRDERIKHIDGLMKAVYLRWRLAHSAEARAIREKEAAAKEARELRHALSLLKGEAK